MLSPAQVLAEIAQRASTRFESLLVYWVHVAADRAKFGAALRAQCGAALIVPVAVNDGFANPNALLGDIGRVLEAARVDILACVEAQGDPSSRPIIVVLLGRTTLDIPQITSPILLPSWFPGSRGDFAYVLVEDLTYAASESLNCEECRIPELCAHLFAFDGAIVDRLLAVTTYDRNAGMDFFGRIADSKSGESATGDSLVSFLERARSSRRSVSNPSGFRPSARDGKFVVSRIVRLVSSRSPDEIVGAGKALAAALALGAPLPSYHECLVTVATRSANPANADEPRFGRNMLMVVSAASMLVTAAAHAGEFARYPVVLLRSAAFDLLRSLDDMIGTITAAPPASRR